MSTTQTPATPPPATPQTNALTTSESYRMPSAETLQSAIRVAITEDRPIMMDYWTSSLDKTACIGVSGTGAEASKLLVKSQYEYTSPIQKIFKVKDEFVIMTENSIYLVDAKIKVNKIDS
jgi:hypothetical protein